MKNMKILNVIIMMLMVGMLIATPVVVNAADPAEDNPWANENMEDLLPPDTKPEDIKPENLPNGIKPEDIKPENIPENLKPEANKPVTPPKAPTEKPTTKPAEKPNQKIPHAGLAEDTMMIASIVLLGGVAAYTFKKISDYQNI